MKTASRLLSSQMLILLSALFLWTPSASAEVTVAKLTPENWETYYPKGKEVDAIYGDYVLQNENVRAVIAMPIDTRNANMTVRNVGGCLIDFVDRKFESDQLSCLYPGKRAYRLQSWKVVVDGNIVNLEEKTTATSDKGISIVVSAKGTATTTSFDVTYSLGENSKILSVTRTYKNETDKAINIRLEDEIRFDGATSFVHKNGDFNGVKEFMKKSANGTHAVYAIQDVHWQQAYGFTALGSETRKVQSNSNARSSSLRYIDKEGTGRVAVEPKSEFSHDVLVSVGKNLIDVHSIIANHIDPNKNPNNVSIKVVDKNNQPVEAAVHFKNGKISHGWVKTDSNGQASFLTVDLKLKYDVTVNGLQMEKDKELSINTFDTPQTIQLSNYLPGTLSLKVVDENNSALPSKTEIRGKVATPSPILGPDSAEAKIRNVIYAANGEISQSLMPGKYDLIISRGPEYDAVFKSITIAEGETLELQEVLKRTVITKGWISSDFHSHSSPSGDNTGSQLGRVANLVCEHVEYGPCTEHNRISTYAPHIKRLGIEKFFSSVPGMELTGKPLPLNHHNTFPLLRKPRTQDGGGPVTDTNIASQIERLSLWDNNSEKLLQLNHPDIGNLFYDKDGNGISDEGFKDAIPFIDVMEIHPISFESAVPSGKSFENSSHRVFNWIQLLNQGYRIPGVVNTDAHYNYHGSGGLRIWIKSPTDEPADIKTLDIVHASEKGNVLMSNGPFLEVEAAEKPEDGTLPKWTTIGDDMTAKSGNILMKVKVQCPNWLDVDRVVVLANGKVLKEQDFTRGKHAKDFSDDVVKFERELHFSLKEDAHLIVIATGMNSKVGDVQGPGWGKQQPTAITNPIFIDVDGNGFQANKDTLGYPLPVKRGKRPKHSHPHPHPHEKPKSK